MARSASPSSTDEQTHPYVCEACGARFETAQELRSHGRLMGLID